MPRVALIFFLIGTALIFGAGCTSAPFAPRLVEASRAEQYLAVARCRNVAKEQILEGLITDSYLTTWGAVYGEVGHSVTELNQPIAEAGTSILFKMPPNKTFCMGFETTFEEVIRAVEDTRDMLGSEFLIAKPASGEYETNYVLRSARLGATQWKEKYFIFVSPNLVAGTDVRVYREVLISRERAQPGRKREFFESTSVGHNEAWYLLQLSERLTN